MTLNIKTMISSATKLSKDVSKDMIADLVRDHNTDPDELLMVAQTYKVSCLVDQNIEEGRNIEHGMDKAQKEQVAYIMGQYIMIMHDEDYEIKKCFEDNKIPFII